MKVMTGLFIITTFALVQCISIKNENEQLMHEKIPQNIIDTSYIMRYFGKMGIDSSEFLNEYETEYFNKRFKDYDFRGKKIFFFGPGGLVFSNKQKYFSSLQENNFHIQDDLYVFDEFEKEESGKYDAAIVYWNKRIYSSKDLVKRFKEKER